MANAAIDNELEEALAQVKPPPKRSIVFLAVTTFGAAQADQVTQARLTDAYRSLPFSFEPNLGQTDARVKFLARTRGISVFLAATDTVLSTGRTAVRSSVRSCV